MEKSLRSETLKPEVWVEGFQHPITEFKLVEITEKPTENASEEGQVDFVILWSTIRFLISLWELVNYNLWVLFKEIYLLRRSLITYLEIENFLPHAVFSDS